MIKVKLTQEQAERIEFFKKSQTTLNHIINWNITSWRAEENLCLNELSHEDIARAWIEGYEIEPQFKEGDIIVAKNNPKYFMEVFDEEGGDRVVRTVRHGYVIKEKVRHATDNEKIFYELGRHVGEFKPGDIVWDNDADKLIILDRDEEVETVEHWYYEGIITELYPVDYRKEFK